ncbi:uncharacterized protein [Venturia canescens]|uniref:uncharacterized protein isoform X2 n=1 Tax=Venturia canescens TaxID=32260 RepID=UPI001C9CD540|nr:uncharacterized protein LOC122407898 isoform X2 [Venturia canescens]
MGRSRSREKNYRHDREKKKRREEERSSDRKISARCNLKRSHRSPENQGRIKKTHKNSEHSNLTEISTVVDTNFAKLTEILSGMVKLNTQKTSNNFINEKFLPEFDPSEKNISAMDWLNKVNTCAILYGWDEKTKLYLAVCKLRGNAKVWYNELHESQLTWSVFSHAIVKQFPDELSFGKLLEEAVLYKSKPGLDLQMYCFKKIGKMNKLKLELTEDKLVDFVAHGICDDRIRTMILASRYKTLYELNNCLSVYQELHIAKTKESNKNHPRDDTFVKQKIHEEKKIACYRCGKIGHKKNDCPDKGNTSIIKTNENSKLNEKNDSRPKCGFCNMVGHTENRCYRKNEKKRVTKPL